MNLNKISIVASTVSALLVLVILVNTIGNSNRIGKKDTTSKSVKVSASETSEFIEETTDLTEPEVSETTTVTTAVTTTPPTTKASNSANVGECLGTFKITAYCSCSQCCGVYASNRPVDANGNEIVYTASGKVAVPYYTVASNLPMGTKLHIDGFGTVEVMDRGVSGNHLDLYMPNHTEAYNWGVKYLTVYRA